MIKRIGFLDQYHTLKSCAGVVLIGAAAAGMILIIRLVGERRLQRFLNFILFFKRRNQELDLVSEALAPDNQV